MATPTRLPGPLIVVILVVTVLVALVGGWLELSLVERDAQLLQVARVEGMPLPPWNDLTAQASWLVGQRGLRLRGLLGVVLAATVVGLVEGWAWRQRHPWGGLSVGRWRLGGLVLWGGLSSAGAVLLVPWPLPSGGLALGLGLSAGLASYLLAAGRPLWR